MAYASMRLLMAGLFLRTMRHAPSALRSFVSFYAAGNGVGAAVWLSSLLVPEPGRYAVWVVGLLVELLAPILAVRTLDNPKVSFHPGHIAERYGLFTIIVLGESVLAVAAGTAGTDWAPSAVFTAALGFVAAACIWWVYFDHVGSSGIELGPQPAFYWGYGHLAVYAGIAAFGVGTQLAVEAAGAGGAHAVLALGAGSAGVAPDSGDYGLGAGLALGGGLALYLAGIAFVDWVNEGARNGAVLPARLGAAALLLGLSFAGSPLSPLAFIAMVVAVLLALTAFETMRPSP